MSNYSPSKLLSLFHKFGGIRLIRAYVKLGVLKAVLKETIKGLIERQSADKIYYRFQPAILNALRERYTSLMSVRLKEHDVEQGNRERNDIIWCCWLQGFENAPAIVKACVNSLRENIKGKEFRFVDEQNLRQYVRFPDYIEERWKKKQIPPAMFADLIRLELLIKYGGTWIDSTVLCTGVSSSKFQGSRVQEYLDADLFLFQFKQSETAQFTGISNWFITSCRNNVVLSTLRDMLYEYWKDFDCVLEYFMFHRFFEMIVAERPDEIAAMPYGYSPNSLALGHNWGKPFKQTTWNKLVADIPFHKLAHQVDEGLVKDSGNYYNYILSHFAGKR